MRDQLYCSIAFRSTKNQCWIITVLPIFKHDYYRIVYYSTEKIQPDICQYRFSFQSHLHPNKNNNTTQCMEKKTYSDIYAQTHVQTATQSQTKQILFFYHTYFLYSIIPSSNFYLCNNLSSFYSRNPRTPANHSVSIE